MKKEDLKINDEVTIVDKDQLLKILKEKDLYIGDETREFIADKVSGVKAHVVEIKNNTLTLRVGESGYFLPFEAIQFKPLTGIEEIAKERKEQIQKHGYTVERDLNYQSGSLAMAAAAYAIAEEHREAYKDMTIPEFWPFDEQYWKPSPDNRIKELAKAGALIAAEIDRLKAIV